MSFINKFYTITIFIDLSTPQISNNPGRGTALRQAQDRPFLEGCPYLKTGGMTRVASQHQIC